MSSNKVSNEMLYEGINELKSQLDLIATQLQTTAVSPVKSPEADTILDASEHPVTHDQHPTTPLTTTIEHVDIHPDGNVVFVCTNREEGKETLIDARSCGSNPLTNTLIRRLRVLAAVVSLSSPVFKAMLGPHFKEGHTLRAENEVVITLPDDKATALGLIFSAMHMREHKGRSKITVNDMVEVAETCDKYDCASSIWAYLREKLMELGDEERHSTWYPSPAGGCDALMAALAVKDDKAIRDISYGVLGYSTKELECSPTGAFLTPPVATNIFEQLNRLRDTISSRLFDEIEDVFDTVVAWPSNNGYGFPGCLIPEQMTARFLLCAKEAGLFPLKKNLHGVAIIFQTSSATDFDPHPPFCHNGTLIVKNNLCANHSKWYEASKRIRAAGRHADAELESLAYSFDLDETGKTVGFTTSGAQAWVDSEDSYDED